MLSANTHENSAEDNNHKINQDPFKGRLYYQLGGIGIGL